MKALKVEADGTIRLPKGVVRRLGRKRELLLWSEGDTIVLKIIGGLKASEFASRAAGEETPLEEISAEVHRMRRERRGRRG